MTTKKHVYYFVSGLGADASAFSRLELRSRVEYVDMHWLSHKPGETLRSYAHRMFDTYRCDENSSSHIVGLSFGGMLATEMADIPGVDAVTLISSATHRLDFPLYLRALRHIPVERLLTAKRLGVAKKYAHVAFGPLNDQEKGFLEKWLLDANADFYQWAVGAIRQWQRTQRPANVHKIHGTKDRILPANQTVDTEIRGAGHLAVFTHAQEINNIILNR